MTYPIKNKIPLYALLTVALAVGILLLDIMIPLGVADGILYITLVLVAFFTKNKKFIYLSAVTGTLLTVAGFFVSPSGGELWQVIANRSLTILTIWIVAILCLLQRGHSKKMDSVRNELERESAYVQLHKDIAIAANETIGLKATLKVCLEKICAHANWPVGHAYLVPNQTSNWLEPAKVWFLEKYSIIVRIKKLIEWY